MFSDSLAHGRRRRDSTGNGLEETVDELGSRPSLMSENVTSDVPLPPLDELDVGLHALLGESGGEEIGDVGVRVKTSESDELPNKSELAQLPNVLLHFRLSKTSSVPVETGAQVVSEPLSRSSSVNTIGELLGLLVDGALGLHPKEVGVRSEGDGSVDSALSSSLVSVESLSGSGSVPVPEGGRLESRLLSEGESVKF